MSRWPSTKARRVLAALLRIGWRVTRQTGTSHRILERDGWPRQVFAYHDNAELGPAILSKIGRQTGLRPEDL